jgi:hypothetical protein
MPCTPSARTERPQRCWREPAGLRGILPALSRRGEECKVERIGIKCPADSSTGCGSAPASQPGTNAAARPGGVRPTRGRPAAPARCAAGKTAPDRIGRAGSRAGPGRASESSLVCRTKPPPAAARRRRRWCCCVARVLEAGRGVRGGGPASPCPHLTPRPHARPPLRQHPRPPCPPRRRRRRRRRRWRRRTGRRRGGLRVVRSSTGPGPTAGRAGRARRRARQRGSSGGLPPSACAPSTGGQMAVDQWSNFLDHN